MDRGRLLPRPPNTDVALPPQFHTYFANPWLQQLRNEKDEGITNSTNTVATDSSSGRSKNFDLPLQCTVATKRLCSTTQNQTYMIHVSTCDGDCCCCSRTFCAPFSLLLTLTTCRLTVRCRNRLSPSQRVSPSRRRWGGRNRVRKTPAAAKGDIHATPTRRHQHLTAVYSF